jgi:anthranilate synthase component 1
MLLDLERNDLGRVCEYGSVKVDEVMSIESYAFVHHIVSNISGKLKKNTTFADIITALFPGGTITGCPKIRSMQIIAELENKPRDAYTGSLGYISNCGKMDFNILIRTIIKQNDDISISAGAGIVYDSDPEKETLETEHKAIGMLKVFN